VSGPIVTGVTSWKANGLLLHRSPILALGAVTSVDAEGVAPELQDVGSPAIPAYEVREPDSKWPRLVGSSGATWSTGTLRIEFRAGFVDYTGSPPAAADLVPERFKTAMKLWVEAMYDRDEKMMPLLLATAENIIRPER